MKEQGRCTQTIFEKRTGRLWAHDEPVGDSRSLLAGGPLTCQVLSPWKKKKSAKPQTTEVQMMQSRGMSLILSPLRSWGEDGEEQPEGPAPLPGLPLKCLPRLSGWML